jgi:hypothetical protein
MAAARRGGFAFLCVLPFVALAFAAPRPLHDLPGHALIGVALFALSLACLWQVSVAAVEQGGAPARTSVLAAAFLLAPWLLVALPWTGIGPPFQASALENQHRYILLMVNALLVGAGLIVLRDALQERGERLFSGAMFAAAIPASGLYLMSIALTLAHATQALQGDHTPVLPLLSHLYDTLEFFACSLTYVCTALVAVALNRADMLGRTAASVFVVLCGVILVLLLLRGIEFPEISGQTAPWYTQPGVVVRIPAMPWVMPGVMGALLLRPQRKPARDPA